MVFPKFSWLGGKRKSHSNDTLHVPDGAASGYVLDCRIESGAHLYYELAGDGSVTHVAEIKKDMKVISAAYQPPGKPDDDTADDYRYLLPKKMSASQASGVVQRELSLFHKLRSVIIQKNGVNGAIAYSSPENKINTHGKVMPFSLLMERLMENDNLIPPCVSGVMFGDSDLLVMMAYPGSGRVHVQASVAPDNIQEIVTSFAAANSITVDIETVPLYTGEDLLKLVQDCPFYANDSDLFGIPMTAIAYGVLSVAGLAMAASSGFYFHNTHQMTGLQSQLLSMESEKQADISAIGERIQSNPAQFRSLLTINYPRAISRAKDLWVIGSTVESDISRTNETHNVILQLRGKGKLTSDDQVKRVIQNTALPDGCRFDGFTLPGALNEIKSRYDCMANPSPIDVFGGSDAAK